MNSLLLKKLNNYTSNITAVELIKTTKILLLVGPTGAGKDSLKEKLLESGGYHHIVSHTTRSPRINHGIYEKDGQDYYFINENTASNMLENNEFIEAKTYSGNLYGTSISEIKKANSEHKIAMTDIEVQGVKEYKQLHDGVIAIFLLPPDFITWQKRLANRYGDVVDADDYKGRLEIALNELNTLLTTNYYIPIVNDNLDETFKEVKSIAEEDIIDYTKTEKAKIVAEKLAADIQKHLGI